jgi:hypothetical protein
MGQQKDPQIFIPIKPQRLSKEVYRKEIGEIEVLNKPTKETT